MFPQTSLVHIKLPANRARMIGITSLSWKSKGFTSKLQIFVWYYFFKVMFWTKLKCRVTWNPWRVWILVNEFHVFHQCLTAETDLLAKRTTGGVGSPDQGGVLQFNMKFILWIYFFSDVSVKTNKHISEFHPIPETVNSSYFLLKERSLKTSVQAAWLGTFSTFIRPGFLILLYQSRARGIFSCWSSWFLHLLAYNNIIT